MVKRVVDTSFWSSLEVIDNYSIEDKYFALYLMTNGRTTQSGIYSLPKKIMSFETGYTNEVVEVLIDRFSKDYKEIIYCEETQEVTLLNSLKYTILKGGKPVSDLLERELIRVQDSTLILKTYEAMEKFWKLSVRKFDQTIKEIFENELRKRKIFSSTYQNENGKENENGNINDSYNENHNENDNEESSDESQNIFPAGKEELERVDLEDSDHSLSEQVYLKKYIEFIKLEL